MGAIGDLYFGRINPVLEVMVNNEEYSILASRGAELYDTLKKQLSEDVASTLDELVDVRHQMDALTAEDSYIKGFRNGAAMMRDMLKV